VIGSEGIKRETKTEEVRWGARRVVMRRKTKGGRIIGKYM
jgi:hypothetical protein